jgi:RHS repeat-associated protein
MRLSALTLCTLLATTALAVPALAQEFSIVGYPVRQYPDENGVDLLTGAFTVTSPSVSIGSADMGLTYLREIRNALYRDTLMGNISVSGSTYTVALGGGSEQFTLSGGVFTPVEQNGSSLTLSGTYTYTRADGTVAIFSGGVVQFGNGSTRPILGLTYPSGRSLTFYYNNASYMTPHGVTITGQRLQSVISNTGWHLKLKYERDTVTTAQESLGWARIANVKGLNVSTDTCTGFAFSCPQTGRPEMGISTPISGVHTYTDAEGRTTSYTIGNSGVTGIKLPGSASNDISVTYTSSKVSSITRFGITTTYGYADASGVRTVTVTRPGGATRVVTFDIAKNVLLSDTNEVGKTVSYTYDTNNRLKRVTQPEANYVELTYDSRGNVTQSKTVGKSGSGPGDIIATAAYPATCSNALTCNQPTSTTDARGNTTDYTYDSSHGGVLTVTAPAATGGANRPQTRITYARLDSAGSISATGTFVPTSSSTCQTGTSPSCVGTADEVKSTIAYGYGLQPSTVSAGAGDNSLTATNTMTYDVAGNLLSIDGPLATADTTHFRWNLNREQVGIIGPDPDSPGSGRQRLARKTTIASTGLVSKVEIGTVAGYTDTDWAAFVTAQEVQQSYDSNRRPVVSKLVSGSTTYALTQSSYDSRGRPECSAIRMNQAAYGSLPSSACTLGTAGSDGPDRISKLVYDLASRVTELRIAVGTGDEAAERTLTYSNNGRVATLKDGENDLTTVQYDDQDRPWKTLYPDPVKGSGTSNAADYEQLTYDANSNVTAFRNRANETIAFTYDTLNRPTFKNLPGSEPDVTYAYDLLGRMTSASQTGNAVSFTFDALSRKLTEQQQYGTISNQFDLAGNRTRITYGDAKRIDYAYDTLGLLTDAYITNATATMVPFDGRIYDSLGRVTTIYRASGVMNYGYDAVSRLTSINLDFTGTANDVTTTYTYNPASQIRQSDRDNDAYAWTGHGNGSTASTANGLNQLTAIGGGTPAYDSRGNLTTDPTTSKTFGYSSENLLTSASGGVTLAYDPLGRLSSVTTGAGTRRLVYDGLDLVAEYDGAGAMLRRFAHGQGADDPILDDSGSALDCTATKFPRADERGSVVALADCFGNRTDVNAYDEFGKPQAGTVSGRFGYTGQAWMPETGLYYYKARVYAPGLGRFLQTDPIGYAGGLNLYAYVANDPVNLIDPLGSCPSGYIWVPNPTGSRIGQCVPEGQGGVAGGYSPASSLALGWGSGRLNGTQRWIPGSTSGGNNSEIFITLGHWEWVPNGSMLMLPYIVDWRQVTPPRNVRAGRSPPKPPSRKDFCGSEGTEWVPDANWADACRTHDQCYATPGASKALCDANLGLGVLAYCIEATWVPPVCAGAGATYWFGVTTGGWGPYLRSQRRISGGGW